MLSGTEWIDMEKMNIDMYISAPQKTWSAPASSGIVMLGDRAEHYICNSENSSSFYMDLKSWHNVTMDYRNGGFKYHATLPTNSLISFMIK